MNDTHPGDFMGKKPYDALTAQAWNGLVETLLKLSMEVELIKDHLGMGEP